MPQENRCGDNPQVKFGELLAFDLVLSLARSHKLTAYDAAYLELAMRLGVPLAARDDALEKVAVAVGVPLFTPPGMP